MDEESPSRYITQLSDRVEPRPEQALCSPLGLSALQALETLKRVSTPIVPKGNKQMSSGHRRGSLWVIVGVRLCMFQMDAGHGITEVEVRHRLVGLRSILIAHI